MLGLTIIYLMYYVQGILSHFRMYLKIWLFHLFKITDKWMDRWIIMQQPCTLSSLENISKKLFSRFSEYTFKLIDTATWKKWVKFHWTISPATRYVQTEIQTNNRHAGRSNSQKLVLIYKKCRKHFIAELYK